MNTAKMLNMLLKNQEIRNMSSGYFQKMFYDIEHAIMLICVFRARGKIMTQSSIIIRFEAVIEKIMYELDENQVDTI